MRRSRRCRTIRSSRRGRPSSRRRWRRSSPASRSRRCSRAATRSIATVLRSRVFVALHMHAGDGNVHTNLPVNSDDYAMLREANAAVARIMALARQPGRRHLGRARDRHHQARIPDRGRARALRPLQGEGRPRGAVQRGQAAGGRGPRRGLHAELFADRPREPDPRGLRDRRRRRLRSRTACAAASASPSARRTCRARTSSIRRATRFSPRRC